MIYQGYLTSVSALREVQTQNGTQKYCTIVVENKSITAERLGMVLECGNDVAIAAANIYQDCISNNKPFPCIEVQYKSSLREWAPEGGQKRTFDERRVISITII